MPTLGRMSLPIEPSLHRRLKLAAARTGRRMYSLIEEAWDRYESENAGTDWTAEETAAANLLVGLMRRGDPVALGVLSLMRQVTAAMSPEHTPTES